MSFSARLAAIFATLVAVAILVTSVASVASTSSEVNNDVDRFLRDRADDIVEGRRDGPNQRGPRGDALSDVIEETETLRAVDADAVVQAIDRAGVIVASTGATLPIEEVDLELAERRGETLRTVEIDGESYRMITRHIDGGGAIQVARNIENTDSLLGSIRSRLLLIGVVLSGVAAVVGWWIARRTTRPLRALTASVENVATTQDLSTAIDVSGTDEVGRLASSFHDMLDALGRSRDQQHQLVQDAAHELRTPLTSIQANIDLLTRAPDLDEATRQDTLAGIRSELRHLNAVFAEIIELATDNRDHAPHQQVDLADVAAAAVATFRLRSDTAVSIEARPSPVSGDPVALARAVDNLLSNAGKFGPQDGTITVVVGDGSLSVRDEGPGIPADEQARVFDRFRRGTGAGTVPGSGLGLAIVQKIVDDHHGHTWICSPLDARGGGTEIGFSLATPGRPS